MISGKQIPPCCLFPSTTDSVDYLHHQGDTEGEYTLPSYNFQLLWLLVISISPAYEDCAEWISPAQKTGHICARALLICWEPTHNIQWPLLSAVVCVCVFLGGVTQPSEHIMTQVRKDQLLFFPLSNKHTYLKKQRDAGLSCSNVVSGRLCTRVEASSGLLLNWMWLLSNSPILCTSAHHLPDNTFHLSLSLPGKKSKQSAALDK